MGIEKNTETDVVRFGKETPDSLMGKSTHELVLDYLNLFCNYSAKTEQKFHAVVGILQRRPFEERLKEYREMKSRFEGYANRQVVENLEHYAMNILD